MISMKTLLPSTRIRLFDGVMAEIRENPGGGYAKARRRVSR
jgi:hypothetical protein